MASHPIAFTSATISAEANLQLVRNDAKQAAMPPSRLLGVHLHLI